MSDLNTDPWIQANSSPVGAERLHALGVITLRWNMCEYGLFGVFCEVVRLPTEECWALVHNLGNVAISDRIKALMALRKFHEETDAQVANVIEYYKACNQNRNSLAHSWIRRISGELVLARQSKRIAKIQPDPIPSELGDLRRIADELEILKVRTKTSSWITKLSHHEADGREFREREGIAVEIFPVLCEAATTVEPRNRAFCDPALG